MKLAVLFIFAFLGCAYAQYPLTPSDLDRDPSAHEGKIVMVRGWLDFGFEKRHLFQREDSESGSNDANNNVCTSVEIDKRLHARATQLNHRYVIVTGTFRSDLARGDLILGLCNSAGIQVDSIAPSR